MNNNLEHELHSSDSLLSMDPEENRDSPENVHEESKRVHWGEVPVSSSGIDLVMPSDDDGIKREKGNEWKSLDILPPIKSPFNRSATFEEFSLRFHEEFDTDKIEGKAKRVIMARKSLPHSFSRSSLEEVLLLDIFESKKDKDIVWIDINSPSKKDLELLEAKFGWHPLTTEDMLEESREKVEVFEHYLYVVAKEIHNETNYSIVYNVNILVFSHYVITIHFDEVENIDQVLYRLKYRVGFASERIMQSSDWVLYSVLDSVSDIFEGHVAAIVVEAEALDELVLVFNSDVQNDLLRRIGTARRLLSTLRSHIWTKRELLTSLTTKDFALITSGTKLYLRDVLDNTVRMEEKLHDSKEMLNNLHSTYLARISIEVAEFSNQVNRVMKKFSAVATIFIPLTLVAGLFGMNVKVPGQDNDHIGWFLGIVCSMVLVSTIFVFIFYRSGWF